MILILNCSSKKPFNCDDSSDSSNSNQPNSAIKNDKLRDIVREDVKEVIRNELTAFLKIKNMINGSQNFAPGYGKPLSNLPPTQTNVPSTSFSMFDFGEYVNFESVSHSRWKRSKQCKQRTKQEGFC